MSILGSRPAAVMVCVLATMTAIFSVAFVHIETSGAQDSRGSRPSATSAPPRIRLGDVGVVVIDPQPAFVRSMAGKEDAVIERLEQLYVWSDCLQIPLITTFERPTDRNGTLPDRLEKVFPSHGVRFEKYFFDVTREPEIAAAIRSLSIGTAAQAANPIDSIPRLARAWNF